MITAKEFQAAFKGELVMFDRAAVAALPLPVQDAQWLTEVGLPNSAAPCLSFGDDQTIELRTIGEVFLGLKNPPADRYRMIGFDGAGDPIAIDTQKAGAVVRMDHEDGFKTTPINASVTHLAACLVAYEKLIDDARAIGGDDVLDGDLPVQVLDIFIATVRKTDASALAPGGLWRTEIEQYGGKVETLT